MDEHARHRARPPDSQARPRLRGHRPLSADHPDAACWWAACCQRGGTPLASRRKRGQRSVAREVGWGKQSRVGDATARDNCKLRNALASGMCASRVHGLESRRQVEGKGETEGPWHRLDDVVHRNFTRSQIHALAVLGAVSGDRPACRAPVDPTESKPWSGSPALGAIQALDLFLANPAPTSEWPRPANPGSSVAAAVCRQECWVAATAGDLLAVQEMQAGSELAKGLKPSTRFTLPACLSPPHAVHARRQAKEHAESLDTGNPPLKTALFGSLFTLAKEKVSNSARVAIASILIDFVLIVLLFITPHYPWAVDGNTMCAAAAGEWGGDC